LNTANFGFSHARGQNQVTPFEALPDSIVLMKGEGRNNAGAIVFGGAATTNVITSITPPNGSNLHYNQRRKFNFSDDLHITRGQHNLSMGAWFMLVHQIAFSSAQNNAGTVSYLGLREFLQDRPSQFQAAVNPQPLTFSSLESAWYFQDEMKLKRNLSLRL